MHSPETDGILSFREEQGSYAPWDHQRVIAKLISGLTVCYQSGNIQLEPLPETMLDEGQASATPFNSTSTLFCGKR